MTDNPAPINRGERLVAALFQVELITRLSLGNSQKHLGKNLITGLSFCRIKHKFYVHKTVFSNAASATLSEGADRANKPR